MKTVRFVLRLLPVGVGLLLTGSLLFVLLGRIERTVEGEGEIRVERYQVVRPQVSGLVVRVFVEPGDRVDKGEPLLQLEDHDFQRNLISVRQSLNEARSRLQKLRVEHRLLSQDLHPLEVRRQSSELGRTSLEAELSESRVAEAEIQLRSVEERRTKAQKLADLGLLSEQDLQEARQAALLAEQKLAQSRLDQRLARGRLPDAGHDLELLRGEQRRQIGTLEAEILELEYQAEQWQAQLAQLETLTSLHTIRSSIPGIVTGSPTNDLMGRYVKTGEDLLNVIDDRSISFVTRIPEQEIVRVRPGQAAYVEIAGLPKQRFDVFRGSVGTVSQAPDLQEGRTRTLYPVQISLKTPWIPLDEGRFYLRSGMQGVARIAYRRNMPVIDVIYEILVGNEKRSSEEEG